jgi:hypothetical protein
MYERRKEHVRYGQLHVHDIHVYLPVPRCVQRSLLRSYRVRVGAIAIVELDEFGRPYAARSESTPALTVPQRTNQQGAHGRRRLLAQWSCAPSPPSVARVREDRLAWEGGYSCRSGVGGIVVRADFWQVFRFALLYESRHEVVAETRATLGDVWRY